MEIILAFQTLICKYQEAPYLTFLFYFIYFLLVSILKIWLFSSSSWSFFPRFHLSGTIPNRGDVLFWLRSLPLFLLPQSLNQKAFWEEITSFGCFLFLLIYAVAHFDFQLDHIRITWAVGEFPMRPFFLKMSKKKQNKTKQKIWLTQRAYQLLQIKKLNIFKYW